MMYKRLATVPLSTRLSALRVRDSDKPKFPEILQTSIKSYYKDLPLIYQDRLSRVMKKKGYVSVYTKPLLPPPHKMKRFVMNADNLETTMNQSYENNQNPIEENQVSSSDYILFRSYPHLYFLCTRLYYEVKSLDPEFEPFSMLDMGHNLGASVWAIQKYFGEYLDDYVIHEHNKKEYNLTVKLLNNKYNPHIDNVTVKGPFSMPRGQRNKFDVVTAINYFPYLQEFEFRDWFNKTWSVTGDYLIIADIANRFTSKRMSQLRSHFLNKYSKEGHIVAPCPHAAKCPMLQKNDPLVCKFMMRSAVTDTKKKLTDSKTVELGLQHQNVNFSYLIIKRGSKSGQKYSRLLNPVVIHDKKNVAKRKVVEFMVCHTDGALWKAKVAKKSSEELYTHVLNKKPGDLIDPNWIHHKLDLCKIDWDPRSLEDQTIITRLKNQSKFSKYKSEAVSDAEKILTKDNSTDGSFDNSTDGSFDSIDGSFEDDPDVLVDDHDFEHVATISNLDIEN